MMSRAVDQVQSEQVSNSRTMSPTSLSLFPQQTIRKNLLQKHSPKRVVINNENNNINEQNGLQQVRGLISRNLINQAVQNIKHLLKKYHTGNTNKQQLKDDNNNKQQQRQQIQKQHYDSIRQNNDNLLQQDQYHPNLLFCLSTCYLSLKQYPLCLQTLLKLKLFNDNFKPHQVNLLTAICYYNLNQYHQSLQVIKTSLFKFTSNKNFTSYQFLILKANILNKINKYQQAQIIFQDILNKHPHNLHIQKQLINIYLKQQNYQKAFILINKTLLTLSQHKQKNKQKLSFNQNYKKYLIQKKLQILYKSQQYEDCLNNLNQLQKQSTISNQNLNKLLYIKGKTCLKLFKYQQAILSFNQILQSHSDPHFLKLSLIQLIIHFLKQRDYYEASLHAKRKTHLFTQNIIQLQHLSLLAQGLILLMKKNYSQGLKTLSQVDLNAFKKYVQKNDQMFISNLLLNAQGYGLLSLGKHQEALIKYESMQITQKDQEYLGCQYNIQTIKGILSMTVDKDEEKALQHFQKAIHFVTRPEPFFYMGVIVGLKSIRERAGLQTVITLLQRGIEISESGQMLYYRALVYIHEGMNLEAMEDLQKAIEISEDNVPEHFYAKGLIYFLQQNLQQAISQFDVALSIDDMHGKSILQKAKCFLLLGNTHQAYVNLRTYKEISEDCTLWQLYFMLHQKKYSEILEIIGQQGDNNNNMRGKIKLEKQENQKQDSKFNSNQKKKDLVGQQKLTYNQRIDNNKEQDSNSIIQIEEIRESCNFYFGRFEESGPSGKLILGVMYGGYGQVLGLLEEAIQFGVNVGMMSCMDMAYLKGYVLFKMGRHQQAMTVFESLQRQLGNGSMQVSNDELEIRVLIIKINCIYCLLSLNRLEQALLKLQKLMEDVNEGLILDQLQYVHHVLLIDQCKGSQISNLNTKQIKGFNCTQQNNKNNNGQQRALTQTQTYSLSLLQNHHLLSHYFPLHTHSKFTFKILIPFPILHIPQLEPNKQQLLQQFTFSSIENKPQPPWIKRGHYGLIFTNQLKQYTNLHLNTQENDHKKIHDLKLPSSLILKLQKITTKS